MSADYSCGGREHPYKYFNIMDAGSEMQFFRQSKVKVDLSVAHNCVKNEIFFEHEVKVLAHGYRAYCQHMNSTPRVIDMTITSFSRP